MCTALESLADVSETAVPLIVKLANGEWFTSKISACGMFASAYPKVSNAEKRAEMRQTYTRLCSDDTPMVRRAAASNLGKFSATVEKEFLLSEMLALFKSMCADDQDSVRLLAIENCTAFGQLLTEPENVQHVLPIVRLSVEDRSWRVRFNVAKEFHPLCKAMGDNITMSDGLGSFCNLLQDAEAEVRAAAAKNISGYLDLIGVENFVAEIVPTMQVLGEDMAQNVRVVVAEQCMLLCPKLGQEVSISQIGPLLEVFLRDDSHEVTLKVLNELHVVGDWMQELAKSLLPAIKDLCKDSNWRVRQAIINVIPLFAKEMGTSHFQSNFQDLFLDAFDDQISTVRVMAAEGLAAIAETAGSEWLQANLMPAIKERYEGSEQYLTRVSILRGFKAFGTSDAEFSAQLLNDVTELCVKGLVDTVPNVKFVACQTLTALCNKKCLDAGIVANQIKPAVEKLVSSEDLDVQFYARACIAKCA
jgi:serine/threonine-protein phosphatase 2A regulatory subunit A